MTDYISRETLLNDKAFMRGGKASDPYVCGYLDALDDLEKVVEAIPAADVAPVVHGKWLWFEDCVNSGLYCSACHKLIHKVMRPKKKLSRYCPNCGAKMDGGDHSALD